jgi:hypothetical protein
LLGVLLGSLLSDWVLMGTTPEQLPGARVSESASAQMLEAAH